MKKAVVVNLGTITDLVMSTSLNKGLKKIGYSQIDWVVSDPFAIHVFEYNESSRAILYDNELDNLDPEYDLCINLQRDLDAKNIKINAKEYRGFGTGELVNKYSYVLQGSEETNMNMFQIFYRIAGLTWKGESCDLPYYPKTRSKKNRAGVAVAHASLRRYIEDNLDLNSMRIWTVPHRKNVLRHMDEINRCSAIVTDNLLTANLAVLLRKEIHYMMTLPLNFKLEFFGTGKIYPVPSSVIVRYG